MTTPSLCPDHLLARARTSALADGERDALEAHLEQCGACRAALRTGQAFDRVLGPQPGDDQLATRLWGEVERQVLRRQSRRARTIAAVAAAAVIALLSVTSVAMLRARLSRPSGSVVPAPASVAARGRVPGARPEPPRSPPEPALTVPSQLSDHLPPPAAPSMAPAASESPAPGPARRPSPSKPARVRAAGGDAPPGARPTDDGEGAGALFSAANVSRRRGETARATEQYRRLVKEYPSSPEALVAHVALGRLLLARTGAVAGALAEFDAYLVAAPTAALAEEALFGRATCLMRLGRDREESATWRQLVERFPRSVYADRARVRLGELPP